MTGDLISREALQNAFKSECVGECRICEHFTYFKDDDGKVRTHCMLIDNAPAIDAVPVVRCKDCVFWMDRHVLLPDGTRRPYVPGEESVTADVGINCGARCMRAAEYLDGNGPFCEAGDFCSRGERKDDEEADDALD